MQTTAEEREAQRRSGYDAVPNAAADVSRDNGDSEREEGRSNLSPFRNHAQRAEDDPTLDHA